MDCAYIMFFCTSTHAEHCTVASHSSVFTKTLICVAAWEQFLSGVSYPNLPPQKEISAANLSCSHTKREVNVHVKLVNCASGQSNCGVDLTGTPLCSSMRTTHKVFNQPTNQSIHYKGRLGHLAIVSNSSLRTFF